MATIPLDKRQLKFEYFKGKKRLSSPVFEFLWTSSFVFVVVKLGTSVALSAEPRRLLARLRLVVGQHVGGLQPLGIVVEKRPLFVEAVGPGNGVGLAFLDSLKFSAK